MSEHYKTLAMEKQRQGKSPMVAGLGLGVQQQSEGQQILCRETLKHVRVARRPSNAGATRPGYSSSSSDQEMVL